MLCVCVIVVIVTVHRTSHYVCTHRGDRISFALVWIRYAFECSCIPHPQFVPIQYNTSDRVDVESLGPALGFYLLRQLDHNQTHNAQSLIYTWMLALCRHYKWHHVHAAYALMHQQTRVLDILRGKHLHVVVTMMNQSLAKELRIQIGPQRNCFYSV